MAADVPEIEEEPDDEPVEDDVEEETPEPEPDDGGEEASPDDVEEAVVELEDDDLAGGDLFDGVDDVDDDLEGDSDDGDGDGDGDDEGEAPDLDVGGVAIEESINDGVARLATVGLTEEDMEDSKLSKDELEEEFRQTFEAFRLGHFGSRFLEEYVLAPQDEEISPAWGLLGAGLMCAAMVVWLRPDGDQAVEQARETIGNIAGGAL